MPEPDVSAERIEAIARDVAEAHAAVARSDAAGAGWRARLAAEAMLQVLCEAHGVPIPGNVPGETTIATLRKALRHAKVLDRRLEDHFAHVQNVGNRAAHAQAAPDLAVDLAEARALLPVLDHVWTGFLDKLPDTLRPPEPPSRARLGLPRIALVTLALVAAPVVAFFAAFAILAPGPTVAPADDTVLVDEIAPADGGVRAEVAPPPATASRPEAPRLDAATRVRADRLLGPYDLTGLDCEALATARNWLWARHGLRLRDETRFAGAPGYHPFTDDLAAVRARFTETDERNLARLDEALRTRSCPCPRRATQPCPR